MTMIEQIADMARDSQQRYGPDAARFIEMRSECIVKIIAEAGYSGAKDVILAEAFGCYVSLVEEGPWIRLITIEPMKKHGHSI